MSASQTELRLQRQMDERDVTQRKHEDLLAAIEARDNKNPSEVERTQILQYREHVAYLDAEITEGADMLERDRVAVESSKAIRRALAGNVDGVEADGDGVVYRTMAAYARDVMLTRESRVCSQIAAQFGDAAGIEAAKQRLQLVKRTPANTLSSNVAGLIPDQHIAQIFQVIDTSRPLVASATRTTLERGVLTYPRVDTSPVVAVQSAEKTEAGNTGMAISMQSATASTYLGGGDLSWQAINWSTPDALDLWFRLAGADYALKTEQDAAEVMTDSAFSNNIGTPLGTSPSFADFMTAVGAGYAEVYANSGRTADTIYLAPDRFGYLLGLTSAALTQFVDVSQQGIGPLRVVVSRGMESGEIAVGDSEALLVAETAGAPVELRVVEPAIGGVEVGLIGAFEAVVVDDGAFAMLTSAT